eukprot:gnl/TRDRNA2_/TRDRNA2_174031_c3_seq5.p1 gnl/TRDRNA2_/TRDRNA2_174031_c3~~gnl/TRDRNA2_/TRDRNA2_174031_c3_seq5.p1  ORF type:complete len:188 (-),score=33.06 gnl/TRDRNA2_/TRDRNA2_174031_c3_seq5:106-669(-)
MRDNWLIWRSVISDSGKPAFTEVATLAHLFFNASGTAEEDRYSLLVLKLHTGCTHQIRVHMLCIGHPLVCDVKYGPDHFAADRKWCVRNFLHQFHLGFVDVPDKEESCGCADMQPGTYRLQNTTVHLHCPLPHDLRTALAKLTPADAASAAQLATWLGSDVAELRRAVASADEELELEKVTKRRKID